MLSSRRRLQTSMIASSLIAISTSVNSEAKEPISFDKVNLGTIGYNGPVSHDGNYKKSNSIRSSYILNNKPQETKANKKRKQKLSAVSRKANRKK